MSAVERNDIFDLAYRFVTETQENVFLTGKAGTGKTTFLKYLQQHTSKNMVVAAPTGVAAINAGGVTLHSLFQLPLHPFLPTVNSRQQLLKNIRFQKPRLKLLRKIELLVIDEISMVRCDVLDAIDSILKSVRRNHHAAFGGVQVLFIGDLHQLPPVAKNDEWQILHDYYASPFFFDSLAVKEQPPLLIELKKIYRQKEERFVHLLNKVRNNYMEAEDFEQLNNRYIPGFNPTEDEKYITLTSHNKQADSINQHKLNQLHHTAHSYTARIEGDFPENIFPADATLVLKEGTQVMFIKNDNAGKRYFNGKIGIIAALADDSITVNCDGEEIKVAQDVWENTRYTLNRSDEKLEQQVLGRFYQYPLRLAWAITIHKSQGLTFDKLMIDAAASFSSGQVYVALSRCTSLGGIVLLSKIPAAAILSNEQVNTAHAAMTPRGSLAERFEGARQVFTLQLLSNIFFIEELLQACKYLQYPVQNNADRFGNDALQWMQDFADRLQALQHIGEKFIAHVPSYLQQQPVIENNEPLQKRIQDAAGYFAPRLQQLKKELEQHHLVTEHKEAANATDEPLTELMQAFTKAIYLIHYCKEVFTITGYLKHRLNWAVPFTKISSYAAYQKPKTQDSDINNAELYSHLRNWRDGVCKQQRLPIYLVANNNSLKEISAYLPLTQADLQQLSGFGKAKAEKYGEEIIAMVQDYCSEHNLETNMEQKEASPKKRPKAIATTAPKIPTAIISFELYKSGKSINDIAKERNLAPSTIEGHLTAFIKTGEIPVTDFVDDTALIVITNCLQKNPGKKHGEIKTLLQNKYSFAQIKATAIYQEWQQNKVDT
ncbi:MAG TPA: helix-turn-helix domain-containing protein [Ferruginibacter sp.]|nr:helix-turn-helix domain-containing protein [Ferruginibacter sp.]HMP19870.1 helix-turn-helix domain-containing protein [Ferruginibacter sp.]